MAKTKTSKSTNNGIVAKARDFGKNIGAKAKEIGARAKAAGTAAKKHITRNKAAYIAGSAGLAEPSLQGEEKPQIRTNPKRNY